MLKVDFKRTLYKCERGGRVIIDNAAEKFDAVVRIYDCTSESREIKMHIGKGVMSLDALKVGVAEIVRA